MLANKTFNNFDVAYYDFPIGSMMKEYVAKGGSAKLLIEPVDGFHPNQLANYLLGEWIWYTLQTDHPDWIGDENPFND